MKEQRRRRHCSVPTAEMRLLEVLGYVSLGSKTLHDHNMKSATRFFSSLKLIFRTNQDEVGGASWYTIGIPITTMARSEIAIGPGRVIS